MKNSLFLSLTAIIFLFIGCSNEQAQTSNAKLSAIDFEKKIKETPNAFIIDVRTPEEFSKGHLQNANNYDWNGDQFDKQITPIDKSKPVFVYCLSGMRSAQAASKMRTDGFKEVYELNGGIMKWRGANLPETTDNKPVSLGMNRQEFDSILNTEKLVLIDFYADWCAPCKKMKPYLDEISKDMADRVVVVRINTDDNQAICKELKIDALPVLQLYRNKSLSWTNTGFIEKAEVLKELQ